MKKLLLAVLTVFTLQTKAQDTDNICWDKIDCGTQTAIAIKTDGTLWKWGGNGHIITDDEAAPQQIGSDTDWISVTTSMSIASTKTYFAIKSNGTLWGWGKNSNGELGDGTTIEKVLPVQIGTDSDWKMVSSGESHTLGLKTNGTIWTWGDKSNNQLGYFSPNKVLVPTQASSDSDWGNISAGDEYNLAIKLNGTLWAWGNMSSHGDYISNIHQIGTDTDWGIITAGYHSVAIKTDGTLWIWGYNNSNKLGLNSEEEKVTTPTKINDDIWLDVKSHMHGTSAIKADGTSWEWGQVALDTWLQSPTQINQGNNWTAIDMGLFYTIGIKEDGTLWGHGFNGFHQFGNNIPAYENLVTSSQIQSCSDATASLINNSLSQISLYPNPTSSMLTLANAENLTIESLSVTDMTGKVVMNQTGNTPQLNVEKLPAGMYFLNVSAQEGVQYLKFIKE